MDRNFLQQWLTYSFSLIHSHTKHVPWSSVPEGMWADCAFAQSTAENKIPLTKTYCSLNWMSEFCTMILIKYRPNLYFFCQDSSLKLWWKSEEHHSMDKIFVFHISYSKGIFKCIRSLQIAFWFGGHMSDSHATNTSAR